MQLINTFVFAYAKSRVSHDMAHIYPGNSRLFNSFTGSFLEINSDHFKLPQFFKLGS